MNFGALMSRLSGFHCTNCGTVLRYFRVLGTAEGGLSAPSSAFVTCDACDAGMCLVERRGWWSPFRLVIGILPEFVLAFSILLILRWVVGAASVPGVMVVLVILGKAALLFLVGMAVAVLENRANHRVRAYASLYKSQGSGE